MAVLIIVCLFAPFPLWLIELVLPFPHIVEELFKLIIVQKIPLKGWLSPVILGVVFAVSESMLYLVNFIQLGSFSNFPLRLFMTTGLHAGLFLLQYVFRKRVVGMMLSLLLAIYIHRFYNLFIVQIFG